MLSRIVTPSLPYLNYALFKFLSNHPLFVEPLVVHPVTKLFVPISTYRFMDGFPLEEGLICSIFPSYSSEALTSPTSSNVSALYKPYDLGTGNHDEVMYHFVIKFQYKEVNIDGGEFSSDPELTTVPSRAVVNPRQLLLLSNETREQTLVLNPPLDIIGDYLELTRLAIGDVQHRKEFPLNIRSAEVVHTNYSSAAWSGKANSFVNEGHLLLRITAYISRGWRDKFLVPLEEVRLDLSNEVSQLPLLESYDTELLTVEVNEANNYIPLSQKGAPFGVAPLDANGRLPNYLLPFQTQVSDLEGGLYEDTFAAFPRASKEFFFTNGNISEIKIYDTPSKGLLLQRKVLTYINGNLSEVKTYDAEDVLLRVKTY